MSRSMARFSRTLTILGKGLVVCAVLFWGVSAAVLEDELGMFSKGDVD